MSDGELATVRLGRLPYAEALTLQERVRAARQADAIGDVLLLVEHPRVYTRGRRSEPSDLALAAAHGIDVVTVRRGGKVTYHGPGQAVGYPIMRTHDVWGFVRTMEQALAAALRDEGLQPRLRTDEGPDYTGVWVGERKIASIGLHVNRGVTAHGFAVNVANDLEPFSWVVACGLPDVAMTSVAQEREAPADPECFARRVAHRFAEAHGRRQRLLSRARLEQALERFEAGALVA